MLSLRNILRVSDAVQAATAGQSFIHSTSRRSLHLSQVLCAEPMKKKKKIDPAIIKMQMERKKKKLEKQIKKAQRFGRKLKPIDELEIHRTITKDAPPRSAVQTEQDIEVREELAHRSQTLHEWCVYRADAVNRLHAKFELMLASQERALSELKLASPALYDKAVQVDHSLLPITCDGPVETPPIPNYTQDGVYKETTKSYELNSDLVRHMLDKNAKVPKRR